MVSNGGLVLSFHQLELGDVSSARLNVTNAATAVELASRPPCFICKASQPVVRRIRAENVSVVTYSGEEGRPRGSSQQLPSFKSHHRHSAIWLIHA